MIPVARDPSLKCMTCEIVFDALDFTLQGIRELPDVERQSAEAHVLGSVCAWWVANGLEQYDGPLPLLQMLKNIFEQQGITTAVLASLAKALDQTPPPVPGVH